MSKSKEAKREKKEAVWAEQLRRIGRHLTIRDIVYLTQGMGMTPHIQLQMIRPPEAPKAKQQSQAAAMVAREEARTEQKRLSKVAGELIAAEKRQLAARKGPLLEQGWDPKTHKRTKKAR